MIYNATLLRLDPPAPGAPGPDVSVRCALAPLTARQAQARPEPGADATSVAYVPARMVPTLPPTVGGHALIRPDGAAGPVLYPIVDVVERLGRTLSHVQIYLTNPS